MRAPGRRGGGGSGSGAPLPAAGALMDGRRSAEEVEERRIRWRGGHHAAPRCVSPAASTVLQPERSRVCCVSGRKEGRRTGAMEEGRKSEELRERKEKTKSSAKGTREVKGNREERMEHLRMGKK